MGLWRKWRFHIVALLIVAVFVELFLFSISLFGIHKNFGHLLGVDYDAYVDGISDEQISDFRAKAYDRELGWDRRPGSSREITNTAGRVVFESINSEGARTNPYADEGPGGGPIVMVFGESYTFGAEVNNDETWAYGLSRLMQTNVINFGVNAYGPDQALLKIKEQLLHYEPEIVILGIMSENINRLMNTYRPFYRRNTQVVLGFKPMLYEGADGRFRFLENPLSKLESREDVLTALGIAKQKDFWYQAENRPVWDFPFSFAILRVARYKFFNERALFNPTTSVTAMYETPEAIRKMNFIIELFFGLAIEHKFLPVVIFIPNGLDTRSFVDNGTYSYAAYVKELRESGRVAGGKLIDVLEHKFDHEMFNTKAFAAHPSPYGTQVIADILFSELSAEDSTQGN